MPSVDVAMVHSLRGGAWETFKQNLVRGLTADLVRRNIVGDTQDKITDVKTAFSSWDNCMAATFCKWPVIAVIIVGGLIILSIVICIGRCLCCGVSCCCSSFKCFKCCGNCCGCFDAPGDRKHKYLDEPWAAPSHGYRAQEPMHFPAQTSGVAAPPQYAEFDVSRKGGEDALPAMPSWEGAGSRKIELQADAVELEPMKKSPPPPGEHNVPLVAAALAPARNTPSPMGRPNQYGPSPVQNGGYMQAPQSRDPYGPPSPASNYHNEPDGYGLDQPYDMASPSSMNAVAGAGAGVGMMAGRNSPARNHNPYDAPANQGYTNMPAEQDYQGRHSPAPGAMGVAGPQGYGMRRQNTGEAPGPGGMRRMHTGESMNAPGAYGMDQRARNSPGPGPGPRRTPGQGNNPYGPPPPRQAPGPQQPYGGYGRPEPERPSYDQPRPSYDQPMNRSYSPAPERPMANYHSPTHRTYSPGPDRQDSYESSRPLARPGQERAFTQSPPHSPITNTGGFDFTSGYSRPQTANGPTAPTGQDAYPGYRAYQP